MPTSPTKRTLDWLRSMGWTCCVVERWNPYSRTRHDALGFGDILACREHDGVMLVQATSADNLAHRRAKIEASAEAAEWLAAGGRIMLVGWRKRKGRWQPTYEEVTTTAERRDEPSQAPT